MYNYTWDQNRMVQSYINMNTKDYLWDYVTVTKY